MTQFKCMICGKVDELDKAIHDSKIGLICEECDRKTSYTSEDICVCCGEVIPKGRQVCPRCNNKVNKLDMDKIMEKNVVTPHTDIPVDIHKIIDDAMEKRDRTVSIYIGEAGVSVSVYPVDHDKVQWIETKDGMICSNCGNRESTWDCPTYCSRCGELMHGVRKEKGDEKEV